MNANQQFVVNNKVVSEEEFVRETFFSCYMLYSVLKDEDEDDLDIDNSLKCIEIIRGHLAKLEGLDLGSVDEVKLNHFHNFCDYHERIAQQQYRELCKLRFTFIGVLIAIAVTVVVCLMLRGHS